VGNGAHYVAVRPDRDPQPVHRFECFTADLHRLADWLQNCGVQTVALQSTGVYWIPLYDILEERGFEVGSPVTNSGPVGSTVSDGWCALGAKWNSFAAGFVAPYLNEN
jgi:hypothetical protein